MNVHGTVLLEVYMLATEFARDISSQDNSWYMFRGHVVHCLQVGLFLPSTHMQMHSANHDVTDLILPYYDCIILGREFFYSASSICHRMCIPH